MIRTASPELPPGVRHLKRHLSAARQQQLVQAVRKVVRDAPLYTPAMPKTGRKMSVRMTNCGGLGWVTDREGGYRYQPAHPLTGRPWPEMPALLLELWQEVADCPLLPEACLINFYDAAARMGLHQDRDEQEFSAPVVSVSLGDDCLFRVGGRARSDPTVSFRLVSGDVVVLGGESRLAFHGVDRIYSSTSTLLQQGGRLNLTLRRVTAAADVTSAPARTIPS